MRKITHVSMDYSMENCLKLVNKMKNYKLEDIVVIGITGNKIKYVQHVGINRKSTTATPDSNAIWDAATEDFDDIENIENVKDYTDSVVIVHNHPFEETNIGACPSIADVDFLNSQMIDLSYLDISVKDALIVSKAPYFPYFSFREYGLLNSRNDLLTNKDKTRVWKLQEKIEKENEERELQKYMPTLQQHTLLLQQISARLDRLEASI